LPHAGTELAEAAPVPPAAVWDAEAVPVAAAAEAAPLVLPPLCVAPSTVAGATSDFPPHAATPSATVDRTQAAASLLTMIKVSPGSIETTPSAARDGRPRQRLTADSPWSGQDRCAFFGCRPCVFRKPVTCTA
jgi:hypothetical protein